jgi:hypothetical protein
MVLMVALVEVAEVKHLVVIHQVDQVTLLQ